MKETRTIKRYQNRKLYDTHQSCYVTLEEIAQTIREGHEIQVIDNKTKNDITYTTQIQLLFDQEKKEDRKFCKNIAEKDLEPKKRRKNFPYFFLGKFYLRVHFLCNYFRCCSSRFYEKWCQFLLMLIRHHDDAQCSDHITCSDEAK